MPRDGAAGRLTERFDDPFPQQSRCLRMVAIAAGSDTVVIAGHQVAVKQSTQSATGKLVSAHRHRDETNADALFGCSSQRIHTVKTYELFGCRGW